MTCGTCDHFARPACANPESGLPFDATVTAESEACKLHKAKPLLITPPAALRYHNPLDMLSEETRAKLARPRREWNNE